MRPYFYLGFILLCFQARPAFAQDFLNDTQAAPVPIDKEKISYALGMNMALQFKRSGVEVDPEAIAQAVKDVMSGKPTQLQESELRPILMQAQNQASSQRAEKNKREGAAFLAKNAQVPGTVALPSGVQYRILKDGPGAQPGSNDVITVNFRATWIDGREFRQKDGLQIPLRLCLPCWQKVVPLMKVGSKWTIFSPSSLAYGFEEGHSAGFGSTLIYEIELLKTEPESSHGPHAGGGRMGHGLGDDFLPPRAGAR